MSILDLFKALQQIDRANHGDGAILYGAIVMLRICYPDKSNRVEELFTEWQSK